MSINDGEKFLTTIGYWCVIGHDSQTTLLNLLTDNTHLNGEYSTNGKHNIEKTFATILPSKSSQTSTCFYLLDYFFIPCHNGRHFPSELSGYLNSKESHQLEYSHLFCDG